MENKIKNIVADWGWSTKAPEFVLEQARLIAECHGKRAGDIVVALGLSDKSTVEWHMNNKPEIIPTLQYLVTKIDDLGAKRQKILALMDGLLFWESDIEASLVLPGVNESTEVYKYCDINHCLAWRHPSDEAVVVVSFSDHATLDEFSKMGRGVAATNPLVKLIGGKKTVLYLADQITNKQALTRGAAKDGNSFGTDSDKNFWASAMAVTDAQRAIASIFNEAIEAGATDIGFIPNIDGTCQVTLRHHGIIIPSVSHPILQYEDANAGIRFLLLRSGADRTSQTLEEPKDGALKYSSPNMEANMRLSFVPMNRMGAKHEMISVSVRVLTLKAIKIYLHSLEIDPDLIEDLQDVLKEDKGLILISAPVNNGKSTTAAGITQAHIDTYGVLGRRRLTVEQPVERPQEGTISFSIEDSQLFAKYTKAVFRHDLDYGFIGEVRDPQAAAAFVRIGTSGHIGMSTTHSKNCISALSVILNYIRGFDASRDDALFVQASDFIDTLSCSIAQRLLPRLCGCSEGHAITEEEIAALRRYEIKNGHKSQVDNLIGKIFKTKKVGGCKECRNIGTIGEIPVVEWLIVTEEIKDLMLEQLHERGYIIPNELKKYRKKSLYESAVARALNGEVELGSLYL